MKLRCKEGDLAIVIHDTPACSANIGRIVKVRGPLQTNIGLGLPCWLITPIRPDPYCVERFDRVTQEFVGPAGSIEHPDAWLRPLRGLEDGADEEHTEDAGALAAADNGQPLEESQPHPVTALRYRPHSYFWANEMGIPLISDIRGAERRKLYALALHAGVPELLDPRVSAHALTGAQRQAQGRIHPNFMGGEYLPGTRAAEVEIARITIASTSQDVICVYARPVGRRIHYRVVDEYEGDTLTGCGHRTSVRPLTLGQLGDFFLGSWDLIACLEGNFQNDGYPREAVHDFVVDASSSFYAGFDSLVRAKIDQWLDMVSRPEGKTDDTDPG